MKNQDLIIKLQALLTALRDNGNWLLATQVEQILIDLVVESK